jgi:hypothetical protein
MAQQPNINYVKEVLKSQYNLGFIGIMIFLSIIFANPLGFAALILFGQIGAVLLSQIPGIQTLIQRKYLIDSKLNLKEKEEEIFLSLPSHYQKDFKSVEDLCAEIESRWQMTGKNSDNVFLSDLITKLGSFRFEYARMLQAHNLTASRDFGSLIEKLKIELDQNQKTFEQERSPKIRAVLEQNIRIIKQRLQKATQLQELLRLLGVRLTVVKNSLKLLQDEVYTSTTPENISGAVDNLLLTLDIDEELRSTYEDILSSPMVERTAETMTQRPALSGEANKATQQQRKTGNLRRVK